MFSSGRISVCSNIEATSSTFYKMYFLLLIIKNPLFLNILVHYFSFFRHYKQRITKISKMLKHTVIHSHVAKIYYDLPTIANTSRLKFSNIFEFVIHFSTLKLSNYHKTN